TTVPGRASTCTGCGSDTMGMSNFVKKMMFAKQLDFKQGQFTMLGVSGVLLPAFTLTRVWEEIYEERGDALFDVMFSVGKQHGEFAISKMGREHHVSKRRFVSRPWTLPTSWGSDALRP
ncbi:MAG: hypothetical protein ABEI97_01370, partial [Candidatus Nanohaloarchaea archaeon]